MNKFFFKMPHILSVLNTGAHLCTVQFSPSAGYCVLSNSTRIMKEKNLLQFSHMVHVLVFSKKKV